MLNYLRIDSAGLPEVHRGFLKLFCKLKRYRNYIQAILTDAYAFLDNAAGGFQSETKRSWKWKWICQDPLRRLSIILAKEHITKHFL
jgi:hypothetical protein